MMFNKDFMQEAINTATKSPKEIPVGAILVKDNKIIAAAHNLKESLNDPSAHAEILVLKEGSKKLKNWRLDDCELYVTLEPCPMCAWAIMQARVKTVYFGSFDPQYGSLESHKKLTAMSSFKPKIYGGIMEKECDTILEDFFKKIRNTNEK